MLIEQKEFFVLLGCFFYWVCWIGWAGLHIEFTM
jgi:hypothetical protein